MGAATYLLLYWASGTNSTEKREAEERRSCCITAPSYGLTAPRQLANITDGTIKNNSCQKNLIPGEFFQTRYIIEEES